ncbi:hypothetical protein [Propionicicella superfundia]|uniref:hypothetical protein n=1 Tax=Propionicicella superfundia TaxID=348582 RepID=UPI00040F3BE6|nr:hypothetical protein [Propionicicella superfundia]
MRVPRLFRSRGAGAGPAVDASLKHLAGFCDTRRGVEAWIEQPSTFARPSLLLIAHDGEWTRRSIPDVAWGRAFAAKRRIPAYDAGVVPYPQRMRDFNARRRD